MDEEARRLIEDSWEPDFKFAIVPIPTRMYWSRGTRRLLHDFHLLDAVFYDFVTTNKHRTKHLSWDEILAFKKELPGTTFSFENLSIPYVGTLYIFQRSDCDLLNIKLVSEGFFLRGKPTFGT
jgi:hypothetical protein